MTDAVVALEPIPLVTSRDWRRAVQERVARSLSNLSANWPRVLLGVVIGLVITLVLGVLAPRPADGPVRGGLGWFALSGITTGLATRLCMVGPRAFVHDVAGFPGRIVAMVIDAGDAAAIHLLLGFASGTLITWLLGPFLAGVTGVGLLLALGTFLRPIVVGASMVVWRWVVTRIAPRSPVSTPIDGMAVSLLSASAAMALTSLIPSVWARAALGIGAVVLALLLRRPARRTGLDLVITVVVGVAAAAVAGVLLVESAGRLDPRDAVGLALGGFALGVCLTTAARSVWPVLGALASGASRWAGACLGAALGGILGLVIGTPTISVALAAVVGVLLLVPTLAEAVSSPVARGVAPLTGSAAPETGLQLLAVGCLALLVAGLTNAAVALAIVGVAIVALVGVRWGARAVTGAATVVVLMATGGSGPAPARAQEAASASASASLAPSMPTVREVVVVVRGDQPVTDTGFDFVGYEPIQVIATGTVQLVRDDPGSVVDANGEPARYQGCQRTALAANCGTLLASWRIDGPWVPVGAAGTTWFRGDGRLYLALNDPDPADTTGSFQVTIRSGPQAAMGPVATPAPAGISRDAVEPGDRGSSSGSAVTVSATSTPDLLLGAVIASLGVLGGATLAWWLDRRDVGRDREVAVG